LLEAGEAKDEAVEQGQEKALGEDLELLAGIRQAPHGGAKKEHFV
jgi:hypothetical protein